MSDILCINTALYLIDYIRQPMFFIIPRLSQLVPLGFSSRFRGIPLLFFLRDALLFKEQTDTEMTFLTSQNLLDEGLYIYCYNGTAVQNTYIKRDSANNDQNCLNCEFTHKVNCGILYYHI